MKRLIEFFRSRTGTILLFHVGILLFCWPLLSITADEGGVAFFLYLFLTWTAMVAVLALMAFAIHRGHSGNGEE